MADNKNTPANPAKSKKRWFAENVASFAMALFLVLIIRSSVIEAFKIPSGSMIPTLLVGDHIFVNKFSYGLKLPFTEWFGDPVYLFKRSPPERGDIIVFKYPKDESKNYIKRVVGIPGDVIEVRNKILYINDKRIDLDPFEQARFEEVSQIIDPKRYNVSDLTIFDETLSGEKHMVMHDSSRFFTNEFEATTVPADQYFVMGDNRDHSNDSRFWGFVPMEKIKGRAIVIWLSLWLDFDQEDYFFRPERIGDLLH